MTQSHNADSQSSPSPDKAGFFDGMSPREALRFKTKLIGLGAVLVAATVATPTALIWNSVNEGREAQVKAEQTAHDQLQQKGTSLSFTAVTNADKSMSGVVMRPLKTAANMSADSFGHLPFHEDGEDESSVAIAKLGQAEQYSGYAPNNNDGGFSVYGRMPGSGIPITNGSFGSGDSSNGGSYQVIHLYKAQNPQAAAEYTVDVVASSDDTNIQAGAFVEKDGWMDLVVYNPQAGADTQIIAALDRK